MKQILVLFIIITVLCVNACSANKGLPEALEPEVTKTQPEETAAQKVPEETDNSVNATVIIVDEQKETDIPEHIMFEAENNAVSSIPTYIGGNIRLRIDGDIYDVCYSYNELALEKDGHVYALWKNDLDMIVETASGYNLDDLYAYTVTAGERRFASEKQAYKAVFEILSQILGSRQVEFDKQGKYVSFTNKLGADFDYYPESDIVYSHYLNACYDAADYHDDFAEIMKSIPATAQDLAHKTSTGNPIWIQIDADNTKMISKAVWGTVCYWDMIKTENKHKQA